MISPEMALLWKGIRKLWTSFSENRRTLLDSMVVKIPMIKKDGTEGKTLLNYWPCAICGELVRERDVDHVNPIGKSPTCDEEIGKATERLFCSIENLQIVCKPCHKKKTKKDVADIRFLKVEDLPRTKKVERRAKCLKSSTKADALPEKRKKKRSPSSKKSGRKAK
jgi:5-methylcytosine-specific restriction endonuclease McrA